MKRKVYLLSFIAIVAILATQSCGKALSCVSKVSAVATASSNFNADQSAANCQAYKTALQNWLNDTDCSGADATTKAEFEADLATLGC